MDQDFKNLNYLLILTAIKVRSIEIRAPYVVDHIFKFSELFTVKFEKKFQNSGPRSKETIESNFVKLIYSPVKHLY